MNQILKFKNQREIDQELIHRQSAAAILADCLHQLSNFDDCPEVNSRLHSILESLEYAIWRLESEDEE